MKSKIIFVLICSVGLALAASTSLAAEREAPMPVRTVKPAYPAELGGQKIAALVVVRCAIDDQGNVTETSVAKSTHPAFDRCAMDALKRWKFKPASEDGQPVAMVVSIPVRFTGDEASS